MFIIIESRKTKPRHVELENLSYKTALGIGTFQILALVPGTSRSGSTITAGGIAKVDKTQNANFTFLMSIPIILAAVLLESVDIIQSGSIGSVDLVPLLFGVITAMVCGYIAIKFMLAVIKKANYKWFSLYLVLLSIANLIVYFA